MGSIKLFCTNCAKEFSSKNVHVLCDHCNGSLEVEEIKMASISKNSELSESAFSRYQEFYPYLDIKNSLSLGEGFTPLTESRALAHSNSVKNILFKNETQNPTWSFKDRGTLVGVLHALSLGYKKIGTVSTGNMAVSVAAYGAKFGLDTYILVNNKIAEEKLNPIAIYKPHLIKVDGDYGQLYHRSLDIGKEHGIYFINSDVPFRVEGYKTIAYEICEQLNFKIPDYVIVPTSAGGNLRGIIKGFEEFKKCGYIDKLPIFVCGQALGCSPIVQAANENANTVSRFIDPSTIAHAIENPLPPSGNVVLNKLKDLKGLFVSVSDEEIISSQLDLAKQGLFVQPASAVSYAAVKILNKQGLLKSSDTIVCVLTGSGLKYTAALEKHNLESHECNIENLNEFIKEKILEA